MTTPHDSRDVEAQTEDQGRHFSKNDNVNDQAHEERRRETAEYGDSSATYWKLYSSEAEISDQKLVETLTTDTLAMSILNGIFSSIIAGFIVQTSQSLQPNNSQETVCLLSLLVFPENSTQQPSSFCPGPYPGEPSAAAIRSNILLLISFFLAMTSVLACGLIQQWCYEFMKHAYPRAAPHKRGRVRTYLFQGINRFYIRRFMYGVHVLLHISVFLFFGGLSDYLHDSYPRVGMASWYCVFILIAAYAVLSILPLIIGNCPYHTALTPPLVFGSTMLLFFCRTGWRRLCCGHRALPPHKEPHFDRTRYLVNQANARAAHLDLYAMKWLFTDDDFSDTDMDKYLQGLPGYIHSHFTVTKKLPEVLTAPYILRRIREHLLTCVTTVELSEQARIHRVSSCIDSLRAILQLRTSANPPENSEEVNPLQTYIQSIVEGLNTLCEEPDEIRDPRAFCVRALAFRGFLTKCLEPSLERLGEKLTDIDVPGYFIPLYTFFSEEAKKSPTLRPTPVMVSHSKESSDKMCRTLLNDGPLINLSLLAKAVLSQDDVDPSILSMCWKTLDILRSGFRINRADVSASALELFNQIHEETHRRVDAEEPGFSVIPLLEILDAVDGGRRLSMVFQDHPNPKYRTKANLVFGKDHLRNPDLFRAFANCLPHFVTKHQAEHPEKSTELMEGLVFNDHLWISLQVQLSNSLRPNSFIPTTLRTFEMCCTVIDAAFVALENSEVDWRSPDFGSLAHYFELFVTDCFQGMFVERALAFRVGLIKSRFCRIVLAHFHDEFTIEGTVVFRSHWDVASLARIFYSLGVGNDADMEFWKSFVDGGPIGLELMSRTHATLGVANRDGPLLNFCKLGYLGLMTVPFKGSGLDNTDFDKLLDLMQKMREDSLRPLTNASPPIWEELRRLQDDVTEIYKRVSGEDGAHMEDLLAKIEEVYGFRPSSTQEHCPGDLAQAQFSETSVVVPPYPHSRAQITSHGGSSSASASTAVNEDRRNSSLVNEVDLTGKALSPFNNSHGDFANVYRTPFPHLPSQIGPSGAITRPFSASFLPNLFPQLGSTDVASPGTSFAHPPLPHMRYNSEHHHTSVYYPPKMDTPTNRSTTLLSSWPPTRKLAMPSNMLLGPPFGNMIDSSTPRASQIE